MKQVKKLLVILPLVALFVLGSLPVLAVDPITVKIGKFMYNGTVVENKKISGKPGESFDLSKLQILGENGEDLTSLFLPVVTTKSNTLEATIQLYCPKEVEDANLKETLTFEGKKAEEEAPTFKSYNIIPYDIHNDKFVYDRLYTLEIKNGFQSEKEASEIFYNRSNVKDEYLYAGFATKTISPVLLYRGAYLERAAETAYLEAMNEYKADIVVFVVPRAIKIETIHIFPEGTRSDLTEIVSVPYEVWASLQHSWTFMNLPDIFKTRIQKINEQGYTFREVKYYSGEEPIEGLLSGYDWHGLKIRKERKDGDFCARIFYDKAVAAAKEVPTEKKVDAATAPQAQIQAPAAQAPVTAANTTTTTAPVNTLPVTGASDSIFLFLSSAALMAVGILFFKKH